ncbi:sigma-70 family RNA polymerase sigma factor [Kitasatospora aburaviensis]
MDRGGFVDGVLAARFEAERGRLRAVAQRMLGSTGEAEEAVQEAWLRLGRAGAEEVANLPGWLTTVVSRICLDVLRARAVRREEPAGEGLPEVVDGGAGPEREALLVESVGRALLVVLERLGPAERVAFVLHDGFAVPFEQIAPIVGRSPVAAKKLASRARRRVRGRPCRGRSGRPGTGGWWRPSWPRPGVVIWVRCWPCWPRTSSAGPTRPLCRRVGPWSRAVRRSSPGRPSCSVAGPASARWCWWTVCRGS